MIQKLVAFALRMPFVVIAIVLGVIVAGAFSYQRLDIEAYPNPVPPLVEIIAQPQGQSGEEVERYVTIPLEVGLAGMPGLDHIRSQSQFGLADVKCYFKWGIEYKEARQEVINRLQFIQLPRGVSPRISPWNAIGELFRYTLRGPGYPSRDLKTQEDWVLERQFKQVDGVIDVVSFGGETKQYHVDVDPFRLRAYGISLGTLIESISNANRNVGGQRLFMGEQSYDVRGIGLLKDEADIRNIVLNAQNGTPVRLREIADVSVGAAPRLGIVGRDDDPDVVQGTVLMRNGGETPHTLEGIHKRVEDIKANHVLPPGMYIEPYYDRGALVATTTHTVLENVLVGMVLVALVLWIFLGHGKAALITALNIPIALLIAFAGMVITDTPANLISIGAVDFGIVCHSTVIMVENIFHHLGAGRRGSMTDRVLAAAKEVAGPMMFSTVIIGVAFLPLFTMPGVSGVIFSPMAHTYAFAIGGAIILALSFTPVLASKFIPASTEDKENFLLRTFHRAFEPLFRNGARRPLAFLLLGLVPVVGSLALFPSLGREFMPKLEEGNFWIRATLPTSISLTQSAKYVGRMRAILRGCPEAGPCTDQNRRHKEIVTVVSQLGRPDDGTDVSGFYNVELFAPLRPFDEWPKGLTKEKLTEELSKEMGEAFPGVVFNFSQMISDNVEEAMSGVKGENAVKVIGPDLRANEANAEAIVDVMNAVPGVRDLGMFHSLGAPAVKIVPDRAACARYGLNTGDVEEVVEAAIGGEAVTQVYEREKAFDLTVRWNEKYRSSVEAIREIMVNAPNGVAVPLGQIAAITTENGPAVIYREDGSRYAPVKFSVRGRDLVSTIDDAQAQIRKSDKVKLGADTHLAWDGEINQLHEAEGRLTVIVSLTLLIIAFLVYNAVKTGIDTVIVLLNIPVACGGGILALFLAQIHFSVSAAMGFISIFGVAIQDAILVVTYFQRLRDVEGLSLEEAAHRSASRRLRAGLMTSLVATLGLLPAAISHGIGSETQKPLALVVIGGSLVLATLTRVLQPPLLVLAHRYLGRNRDILPPAPPSGVHV
jgi:cobalt-zinc-cadmium resistance protein CzcA